MWFFFYPLTLKNVFFLVGFNGTALAFFLVLSGFSKFKRFEVLQVIPFFLPKVGAEGLNWTSSAQVCCLMSFSFFSSCLSTAPCCVLSHCSSDSVASPWWSFPLPGQPPGSALTKILK